MDPQPLRTEKTRGITNASPALCFRSVVRKSALFNLTIVLTSFPFLIYDGGPKAIVPTVYILAGISFLIWIATFTLHFFVSLPRLFGTPAAPGRYAGHLHREQEGGTADRWLDGPI
jgi:hypothetical protein